MITLDVALVQRGLSAAHHESGGRVQHPGRVIDGRYGRFTERSLASFYAWDQPGQGYTVLLLSPDGVTPPAEGELATKLRLDDTVAARLVRFARNYSAAQHRQPIASAPAPTSPPVVVEPGNGAIVTAPSQQGPIWPYIAGGVLVFGLAWWAWVRFRR